MKTPAEVELRLAEIVLTAADLEASERQTYLRDLAITEPELAAEARRRLAAAEQIHDSFLATPAAARLGSFSESSVASSSQKSSAAALPAEDRYELGRDLGCGGMGRVVEAFDCQLGRKVALKFLTHEDPEVLHLFLSEARHQARVRHDHVLEIYDSGELDGRPFLAMQLATEGTLAEVGDRLPLEGKVRLLSQAAEGLHAAHRQGLLHRDVKPSNILVERSEDGDLRALVTDFGLATEIDDEGVSESDRPHSDRPDSDRPDSDTSDSDTPGSAALAGSPYYIAPERLLQAKIPGSASDAAISDAAGHTVDRRSDVYSLGITMYRLLTGELPFSGQNTVQILRRVADHDLPPPRLQHPELPAELEAIILRSTARRPQERYASARAVAQDLQRYLDGEVVEAYAAGLAYRLTRFVLRNRLLMGMAVILVVGLALSSVAVTVFALRADASRQRAEARHGQAEELIHFMVFELRDKLAALGRLDILTDLGSAAMEYFAAVPDTELSESELSRRSRMLYQIGEVRVRQGDLQEAQAPFEESLALAQRLADLAPDDGERLFELGQAHFWVGYVSWEQGDFAAARGPFEDYLEISRQLVTLDPTNLDWRQELSYAHSNLGSLDQAEGAFAAALGQFLAALEIDQQLVAAQPKSQSRSELAATHNTVGVVLRELGRLEESGQHLRADLAIRREMVAEAPEDPRTQNFLGISHGHLGIHLFLLGDRQAAAEHFQAQREIFGRLAAHDPANSAWRYKLVLGHLNLVRSSLAGDDLAAAKEFAQQACQGIEDLLADDSTMHKWRRTQGICLYHRALLHKLDGDPEARAAVLEAIQILTQLADEQPRNRPVHRWLSLSYLLLGSVENTADAARAAFELALASIAPLTQSGQECRALALQTRALLCLGRSEEARPGIEELARQGYSAPRLVDECPARVR